MQLDVFLGEDQILHVEPVNMGVGLHQNVSQEAYTYAETRTTRARKSFLPMLSMARAGGETYLDKDVMLYVYLSGDHPGAPMSFTSPHVS